MRRFWMVVCLVALCSGAWAQEQSPTVAVMPFVVRGQPDVAQTQRVIAEVLTRQLTSEGVRAVDAQGSVRPGEAIQTEEQARTLARRLGAGYTVTGSFTQVGNSISLDARLIDATGAKRTELLFAEERGMENLAAATNVLIQQMSVHLLAKAVIADVQVRGNDRIEADAIKATVKSKKGELLRPEQVREDIRAIYGMGFFENVDADVADTPGGKLLTFVVKENPTVQEVRVKGNRRIKEKDLLAAVGSRPYTILQRNIVNDDVQKIIKLYHDKGYFNVDVTSSIDFPRDPRHATVSFEVKENRKVYIDKITFTGNKHFSDRKLRGIMQTKQKTVLSWFTQRGILQRDVLDADADRLTAFYHDKGFMDAKVGTPEINRTDEGFHIQVPVEEGERYKISGVKIAGDPLNGDEALLKRLESKPSEYFSREQLRHDIEVISKSYMDEGYAYTEVNPSVKREPEDRTTDITYQVNKKEKVRIGRIFITGNTKTRDKVIRRELKLAEGDTFSSSKLERSITNLRKLDFFEEVEITPSQSDQPGLMNLNVKVKEKLTGAISMGGGFSSDDGLFATGEILQRNLFGRGQYLGFKAYFGEEAQRYVASFTEPSIFDSGVSAGIDVYDWVREYQDFTKDSTGFRLRTAYPFGNYSRMLAYYTFENAEATDISISASPYVRSQLGEQVKSSVTVGAERDSTDHPFLPTRGSINSVTVETSSGLIGSDSDFVKSEFHSGWYIPLVWKLVGFVRGEFGYIWEIDDDDTSVPIYERFFLGGINSLRAFDWGDVGPRDEFGNIIGGLTYGVVNVELLFPLMEKAGLRGVVFFDAGNAYEDFSDFDVSTFRTDAGAGIRWNSPLGPLRIEWGYNLDPEPGEDNYQWQFSAGAFF